MQTSLCIRAIIVIRKPISLDYGHRLSRFMFDEQVPDHYFIDRLISSFEYPGNYDVQTRLSMFIR